MKPTSALLVLLSLGCSEGNRVSASSVQPTYRPSADLRRLIKGHAYESRLSIDGIAYHDSTLYVATNVGLLEVRAQRVARIAQWLADDNVVSGPWYDESHDRLWIKRDHDNVLLYRGDSTWTQLSLPKPPNGEYEARPRAAISVSGKDLDLDKLLAVLRDSDFDFDGQITILRVERSGARVELLLEVRAFSGDFERQAWRVSCEDERRSLLHLEPLYGMELLADHILLAPYRDARVELGIKGAAQDPQRAVADLWEAHCAIAGDWVPFTTFLNRNLPLADVLASSAAIIADGPSRVMSAYARALESHVAEVYSIRERAPMRWLDLAWQPEDPDVQLLMLEPHDYIIGRGFSAQRVSPDLLPPLG
jgi:hypothetical protein